MLSLAFENSSRTTYTVQLHVLWQKNSLIKKPLIYRSLVDYCEVASIGIISDCAALTSYKSVDSTVGLAMNTEKSRKDEKKVDFCDVSYSALGTCNFCLNIAWEKQAYFVKLDYFQWKQVLRLTVPFCKSKSKNLYVFSNVYSMYTNK